MGSLDLVHFSLHLLLDLPETRNGPRSRPAWRLPDSVVSGKPAHPELAVKSPEEPRNEAGFAVSGRSSEVILVAFVEQTETSRRLRAELRVAPSSTAMPKLLTSCSR